MMPLVDSSYRANGIIKVSGARSLKRMVSITDRRDFFAECTGLTSGDNDEKSLEPRTGLSPMESLFHGFVGRDRIMINF
ncbi:MAG: hypothetical protein U5O39_08105 [Gammaproteobacteria bacterium]|nr:hypothetical protein [Gammaproteobacteria bacterium]